ncbi:amidase [Adhaeribacter pallidiroseus]|uniref:Amidase n=1 Tax=Adhaeribacter pallidiroseus TaxID=2072847 RepID=A0A369QLR1_9BACT|nr:amidase [Adhaeribacter pallidiroseus]RDC63779.1 Amidase [Adhaeribacter pallidiroseus]
MNRRYFLKNTGLAGLVLPTILVSSCQPGTSQQKSTNNAASADSDNFELNEVTVADLQQKMEDGTSTSRSITQMYLDRIKAIDQAGPHLKSVIEINPDALRIADTLDQERKAGKVRGLLHGVPVLIKDNIDSADKMATSAGSIALAENHATKDAFVTARLREAGAVILGKTNLSEWANFRSTRSASGWSSRGGQTKNPYVLDRSPCGSSSGSGVAVAANLCAVAVGTETDGSVVCPAAINSVVGIKPTVGLVSRSGIIPISKTQDTAGPLARTVRDAAILLGALTGIDPADAVTQESTGKTLRDYTPFLDVNGLQGKRIGVEKAFLEGHEDVTALLQKALAVLKSKGATIVEVEIIKKMRELGDDEYKVLQYEFKDGLNKYLAQSKAPVKSLPELIAFNKAHEDQAMPFFKQEILESSEALGDLNSPEYLAALKKNVITSRNIIQTAMQKHNLQAISGPTYGPSWCIDLINGDSSGTPGYSLSSPAAISGFPHITVPMGQVDGLPIGLSFFGTAYTEPELIKLAYAYEQASKTRVAPTFKKTTIPA